MKPVRHLYPGEKEFLRKFLQRLQLNPFILEIGTFRGLTSILFAKSRPDANIVTIDSHVGFLLADGSRVKGSEKIVSANLLKAGVQNQVKHIKISSRDFTSHEPIDLLYIDGDLSYESVMHDFDKFSKFVKKGGWVMVHDYSKSEGATKFCHQFPYEKIFQSLFIIKR